MERNIIRHPRIGEVYQIKFEGRGSVQDGWRPGVVIQNNIGNIYSPNIIAVPLTSALKKEHQPTHVFLPAKEVGLKLDSVVLCENPETISKESVGKYITNIPQKYMSEIATALMFSIPMLCFLKEKEISNIWYKTSKLVL